jgi:hypothetical protein
MAIILSFYTGEQICQDCAQQPEAPCTKCSPGDDERVTASSGCVFRDLGLDPPPEIHDRLVLDTTAD